MDSLKASTFLLDAIGSTAFAGFTKGTAWNGFQCPYFTFDQAQAIVEAWRKNGWQAHYDESAETFTFSVNQDLKSGHSDEFDTFGSVIVDGQQLYPIGASGWAWEHCSEFDRVS